MILRGAARAGFSLEIVGYEFPDLEEDPHGYDVNWLVIDVDATDGKNAQRFRGPYLLTMEVAELAEWLDAVARGEKPTPLSFTEPALEFHGSDAESSTMVVYVREHRRDSTELEVWLEVSADDAHAAARDLRHSLDRFPYRRATTVA